MDDFFKTGKQVILDECRSLQAFAEGLDQDAFEKSIQLLLETARAEQKIFLTGVGKSRQIGDKICATLRSTGLIALELDPVSALHGDLGMVHKDDVVIALSYSGTTEEIVTLMQSLGSIQARIIAVTGNPKSPIATGAEVHLNVDVDREACPLNLAPTSSALCMLALGDALAMTLMSARKIDREDFARNHPAGALGRALTLKAEQMMRPLNRIVLATNDTPVNDAIDEMNRQRCGATVIRDQDGHLTGIFTHGDFARSYRDDSFDGNAAIVNFMTHNPISVRREACARDVLELFEQHRIEDLVVVDAQATPVGIIDLQDISRLGFLAGGDES